MARYQIVFREGRNSFELIDDPGNRGPLYHGQPLEVGAVVQRGERTWVVERHEAHSSSGDFQSHSATDDVLIRIICVPEPDT